MLRTGSDYKIDGDLLMTTVKAMVKLGGGKLALSSCTPAGLFDRVQCLVSIYLFPSDPPENCHLTVKKLPKT